MRATGSSVRMRIVSPGAAEAKPLAQTQDGQGAEQAARVDIVIRGHGGR